MSFPSLVCLKCEDSKLLCKRKAAAACDPVRPFSSLMASSLSGLKNSQTSCSQPSNQRTQSTVRPPQKAVVAPLYPFSTISLPPKAHEGFTIFFSLLLLSFLYRFSVFCRDRFIYIFLCSFSRFVVMCWAPTYELAFLSLTRSGAPSPRTILSTSWKAVGAVERKTKIFLTRITV